MTPFTLSARTSADFIQQLSEKISEQGTPTLCIAFTEGGFDIESVGENLAERSIDLVGVSTTGGIYDIELCSDSFTAMFLYLDKQYYNIYSAELDPKDFITGAKLGNFVDQTFDNPGVLTYLAGTSFEMDIFIDAVKEATYKTIPLYGGLAFDNFEFRNCIVFTNDQRFDNGLVSVVFDCDKIEIVGGTYSGWDSIGITHTVTKADGNTLYEIDGKPALSMFKEYFDYIDTDATSVAVANSDVVSNHPIKIIAEDGSVFLRSAHSVDSGNNSMQFAGTIQNGQKFKFCSSPTIGIVNNLVDSFTNLKNKSDVDCLILTSCACREYVLGPFFKDELKKIYNIWEKPIAGFLSGGELGNDVDTNISNFHNVTCSILGFKILKK